MQKKQEKYGPWALVTGASSGIGAEFDKETAVQMFGSMMGRAVDPALT